MRKLIECASCGGLKRVDSARCPHCRAQGSSLLKSSLAAAGFGAMVACCPNPTPCTPAPLGACLPVDSGPSDSGTLTDSGSDGSQSFIGLDAYGTIPFRDAGPGDSGGGSGDDDD
jgi:hypothetical protein